MKYLHQFQRERYKSLSVFGALVSLKPRFAQVSFETGTSPARLADCLRLDSSKFQYKLSDAGSKDASNIILSVIDDGERYHGCEPLQLSCPSCSSLFECPPISSFFSLKSTESTSDQAEKKSEVNFWIRMQCSRCPDGANGCKITSSMIANQVERQAEQFISLYYKGLMMCDDESCKYTTRCLNLRVMGESKRGTICSNYPRCSGHLVRQYNEADLYRKLSYFCYVLDATRFIEKFDQKSRAAFENDLATICSSVDLALPAIQKIRDRCAYGWVQLKDLVVSV